ncbi:DUF2334 domain-containing protein [Streptomyces sp. NPDC048696]|uniref:DUF2334 domain-containing protein n=1 Tax=Streptomyces sp. NPDC048696 TaxID=3365585 RepID=UPI00371A36A9
MRRTSQGRRRGRRPLSVVFLLIAALLGTAVAASAAATDTPPPGAASVAPVANVNRASLAGWARTHLAKDQARRAAPHGLLSPVTGLLDTVTSTVGKLLAQTPDSTSTLVLYDTAGPYGYLGELYAMAAANLGGHFGTVTAKPVQQYTPGMLGQYTAAVYLGSTYYGGDLPDAVPAAFYQDVLAATKPVIWVGDNIWNMGNAVGVPQFTQKYGWDPTTSYFADASGSIGNVTQVTYGGQALTRKIPAGQDGGVLRPNVLTGAGYPPVTTVATALDSASGATFPWAVRSANLTYVGEIPFSYVSESDRVIAFEDMLFDALAPATATRHRAMMRLEDISPESDPTQLRSMADYLFSQHIPYGINVIPVYTDPNGVYNGGTPQTETLAQKPQVVSALNYMLARGAVLMEHGYTHQYSNVNNPYTGVTGDDFEFYRAHIDSANNVVYDGPVAEDSTLWAQSRVTAGLAAFAAAGLPRPQLWTTPHYAASATDYRVFSQNYSARLERSLYFAGTLSGGTADPNRFIGQFFPYVVNDVYGTKVLPEDLGNYEPVALNNHPPRLPADLVASAKANLAVRDGIASFFYHPYYPLQPLKDTVDGIKALGYTFVSPAAL